MKAFLAIGVFTLRKLMGRRRVTGLLLLTVLPAIIVALVGKSAGDPEQLTRGLTVGVLLAVAIPVVALVNSSAALGDQRREHLLPYMTLKPLPRSVIVGAVLAGSVLATLAIGGAGVAALWLAGGWVTGSWTVGWPAAVALIVSALSYGAVFIPVGYLFRRGTLIGLIYIFFWEAILASAVPTLATSSLWRIGLAAYLGLLAEPAKEFVDLLGTVQPGVGGAFVKAGVLVVVSVLLTTWLLRSRDQVI
ncbi:hypothetical protein BMS3Abin02_00561 [bacterium BMS3Abin02]|nr:hypothetical protein BMS3Abin02_00561 [bacterium BMS3Abin02]GBE22994.1 hypothetical protein BMS3Bbin01_02372 [bacterium BMS3Bbin01]HDH26668.1 hypothetical protein [Actinomycetota bacterium]HDK45221.1 hypothetical protein [Actinomycetota bacterium]